MTFGVTVGDFVCFLSMHTVDTAPKSVLID